MIIQYLTRRLTRGARLRKHITTAMPGIEVGPYFNPVVPKSQGYNAVTMDVFDTAELRRRAEGDSGIPREKLACIEDVDVVGSASDIGALVSPIYGEHAFEYVVSSHNFEHLPDPIKFLQGCSMVLKDGGVVSMAVPDLRCSFDHYRWPTTLADWLDANLTERTQPTPAQCFEQNAYLCYGHVFGKPRLGFPLSTRASKVRPLRALREAYGAMADAVESDDGPYRDAHCSTFTPSSLRLLIEECRYLGLIDFEVLETIGPVVSEFYIHLRRTGKKRSEVEFYRVRDDLMRRTRREIAAAA